MGVALERQVGSYAHAGGARHYAVSMMLAHLVGAALALLVLVPDAAAGVRFNLAAVLIGLVLLVALLKHRVTFVPVTVVLLCGYYFVIVVATIAQHRVDELLPLLRVALPLLLLALAASAISPQQRPIILRWVVVLALIQAGLAISQRHLGWPIAWGWLGDRQAAVSIGYNPITDDFGRSTGTMAHGIPLALLLATGIVLLWPKLRSRKFLLPALGIAALGYAVILTGSRSAIIVLAATGVVMALMRLRNPIAWTFTVIAAILTVLLVDIPSLNIFASLDGSISLTHRSSAFEALGNLIALGPFNAIFGNGWGANEALGSIGALQSQRLLAIDNGFVALISTAGFIGALLIVALIIIGFRHSHGVERAMLILTVGMFFSFDVPLWMASFAPLIVLCCLSTGKHGNDEKSGSEPTSEGVELAPAQGSRVRSRA